MSSARSFKSRVRSLLVETPLRHVASPAYRELTRLELRGVRLYDELCAGAPALSQADSRRITAIVKTFERPRALARLLESLQRWFPHVPVLVADDSRAPQHYPGVRTIALPFDVGVSAGRQAALDHVETELTWVLDDDFVVYRGTGLAGALATLMHAPELDILGGPVIDLPLGIKQDGSRSRLYPTTALPLRPLGSLVGGLPVRDKVPNFFLARSDRLRLVGWDPGLKRLDHGDFFTRARGVLVTVYDDNFRCLHTQTPFDRAYMRHRLELSGDAALLHARYFG